MLRVLLAQYRVPGRNEPVNSKAAVKDADAPVRFGMVELIALVLEHRCLAQHGEPVGETFRDEELPVIILRQLHGHVLAVGRRAIPDVHGHVQHLAPNAPHQLGLRERRPLEVQSPHHAVARHALVVLHERHVTYFLVKLPLGIALEEIASRVLEDTWFDNDHAVNICLDYFHSAFNIPSSFSMCPLSRPGWREQILAVVVLQHRLRLLPKPFRRYPSLAVGDALQASHL